MENHLLPTSKALSYNTMKKFTSVKISNQWDYRFFCCCCCFTSGKTNLLNEVIDLQHFVCKRAYFKRK